MHVQSHGMRVHIGTETSTQLNVHTEDTITKRVHNAYRAACEAKDGPVQDFRDQLVCGCHRKDEKEGARRAKHGRADVRGFVRNPPQLFRFFRL